MRVVKLGKGAAFIALLALAGCPKTQSKVARGESFETGDSTYDAFFSAVAEMRTTAMGAEDEEKSAHGTLAHALGLESNAEPTLLFSDAGSRAFKLKESGVLLHLELAPEAKMVTHGNADLPAQSLVKAIEDSARVELTLEKKLGLLAKHAAELEKKRTELRADAPNAFKSVPQAKRDEVIAELDACQAVIASANELGAKSAGRASTFVLELAHAVETGGASAPEPPPVPPSSAVASKGKPPGGAKRPPGSGPAKPPSNAAAPPAKPPAAKPGATTTASSGKKPKGGDDFEP